MKHYEVRFKPSVQKTLDGLQKKLVTRILNRIEQLAVEPRPRDARKLKGSTDYYRIRSGDYRIIYTVQDDIFLILVVAIGERGSIYKRLKSL